MYQSVWVLLTLALFASCNSSKTITGEVNFLGSSEPDTIQLAAARYGPSKSGATEAGISIGGDYLLTADVLSYTLKREAITKEKPQQAQAQKQPAQAPNTKDKDKKASGSGSKPAPEKKPAIGKGEFKFVESETVGYTAFSQMKTDFRLISVKTGEILWQQAYETGASIDYPLDDSPAMHRRQEAEVLRETVKRTSDRISPDIFKRLNAPRPVLKMVESKGKEAQKLLIGGGSYAGNFDNERFIVVAITEETVDGQKLKREEPIGKLRATDLYPETTLCSVSNGEDKIFEAISAGIKLICRPDQ